MTLQPLLLTAALLLTGSAHAATLTLEVQGLRPASGHVFVAVHTGAGSFSGKGEPVAKRRVDVTGTKLTLTFPDLAPGTYAVNLFHDTNGNAKLDTNLIGFPTEGYGFSNNVGARGRPTFDEAKFTLAADGTTLTLVVL